MCTQLLISTSAIMDLMKTKIPNLIKILNFFESQIKVMSA